MAYGESFPPRHAHESELEPILIKDTNDAVFYTPEGDPIDDFFETEVLEIDTTVTPTQEGFELATGGFDGETTTLTPTAQALVEYSLRGSKMNAPRVTIQSVDYSTLPGEGTN